eukprot:Gregarina_sp_Poly_1__3562@NODE_2040_length_2795_cov_46_990469_g1316_i0_p3_GENE_NODE_2040_length_2795_cov_46_990469_g1316_i0NODE_2040_length_2795_cov_46_990469_g1316_i0_p3_ORF_typecomplete_len205_score24_73DNMT1RFD/PF12047_8/0_64DNMT1RFD/PF12047_8/9_6e02_NODE_2040_length_2795_cov_46_990469_g1316_i020192633
MYALKLFLESMKIVFYLALGNWDSDLWASRQMGRLNVTFDCSGLSVLNVTTESRPDDEQRERQRQHSFRKELTALREVLITFGPQTLDPNEWLRSELEWLEAYHRVSLRSLAYLCNETAARQLALHQRQEASELSEIAEHCGDLCEDSTVDEFTGLEAYMLMYLVVRTLRADQFLRTRELLRQVRGKSALWHHEYGVPERFQGL